MRSSVLAFALAIVGATASAVRAPTPSAAPGCVSKCWANSQYVSTCAGNHKCLCDDADFQNAMYQCLYSQCQTAQFGTALHHALGLCQDEEASAAASVVPALLRQGSDLRKRQGFVSQSVSVSAYPTRTASRVSQSVSASNYQTYSTSRALSSTLSTVSTVVSPSASATASASSAKSSSAASSSSKAASSSAASSKASSSSASASSVKASITSSASASSVKASITSTVKASSTSTAKASTTSLGKRYSGPFLAA